MKWLVILGFLTPVFSFAQEIAIPSHLPVRVLGRGIQNKITFEIIQLSCAKIRSESVETLFDQCDVLGFLFTNSNGERSYFPLGTKVPDHVDLSKWFKKNISTILPHGVMITSIERGKRIKKIAFAVGVPFVVATAFSSAYAADKSNLSEGVQAGVAVGSFVAASGLFAGGIVIGNNLADRIQPKHLLDVKDSKSEFFNKNYTSWQFQQKKISAGLFDKVNELLRQKAKLAINPLLEVQ